MMRKFLMWFGISMVLGTILGLATYFIFRIWEESHIAKGVTISVKDFSNSPIPAAIIELQKIESSSKSTVSILSETNQNGEVYFRRLTQGRYNITARIYCDERKTPATHISLDIQGQNTQIQYFPCG